MSNKEGRRQHYHLSISMTCSLHIYHLIVLSLNMYMTYMCVYITYIQHTLFPNKQLQLIYLICMWNLLGICVLRYEGENQQATILLRIPTSAASDFNLGFTWAEAKRSSSAECQSRVQRLPLFWGRFLTHSIVRTSI